MTFEDSMNIKNLSGWYVRIVTSYHPRLYAYANICNNAAYLRLE